MKVTESLKGTIKFCELACGDTFQYNGRHYLKVFGSETKYNAVLLSTGDLGFFPGSTNIRKTSLTAVEIKTDDKKDEEKKKK